MKAQRRPGLLFWICLVLFLWHQYIQKIATVSFPFLHNYLDPLLFMPILLTLVTWERRLIYNNRSYTLPLSYIFGYFLLVSLLCEVLFPMWTDSMVSDIWDVLCYALGTFLYIMITTPYKSANLENI